MECLECGRKFVTKSLEPKCPGCGGYDVELAGPPVFVKGGV